MPGSRGEGWGSCKVPETIWSHWLSWTGAELWLSQWEPVLACFLRAITPAPPPPVSRKPMNLQGRKGSPLEGLSHSL